MSEGILASLILVFLGLMVLLLAAIGGEMLYLLLGGS